MPLGIISPEQLVSELGNVKRELPRKEVPLPELEIKEIERGRGDAKEVPAELRALISREAIAGASNGSLAKAFGVSESSVSAYKNDATSCATYNKPNENLKRANDLVRDEISGMAYESLKAALRGITSDKMESVSIRVLAGVAKSLSGVVRDVAPDGPVEINHKVIVFKPRQKEEDDYEVIDVRALEA